MLGLQGFFVIFWRVPAQILAARLGRGLRYVGLAWMARAQGIFAAGYAVAHAACAAGLADGYAVVHVGATMPCYECGFGIAMARTSW